MASVTWDQAVGTWDEAQGTWDNPGYPPSRVYMDKMSGGATASGSAVERFTVERSSRRELDTAVKDDMLTIGFGLALGGAMRGSAGALVGGAVFFAWGRWARR
jgi:hypothetical protein